MGNPFLVLIRNRGIEYAIDCLSLSGKFVSLCQDRLGYICVDVNPRIVYNMMQSPWFHSYDEFLEFMRAQWKETGNAEEYREAMEFIEAIKGGGTGAGRR